MVAMGSQKWEVRRARSIIIALADIFLDSFSILALSSSANFDSVDGSAVFLSSNSSVNISVSRICAGSPTVSCRKFGDSLRWKCVFWS
jgi:hypothetical protein